MNCGDVNRFLDTEAHAPLPPEIRQHAETCVGCRRLLETFEAARNTPLPAKAAAIPQDLLDDLRPVKPLQSQRAQLISFLGAAAVVAALGVAMWGLRGWQAQNAIERTLTLGAALFGLCACAYGLTVQMVPGSVRRFSFFNVECGALVVFAATVLAMFHRQYSFPLADANLHCFERGLGISALAAVFLLPRMRRGVWLNRELTALNVGTFLSAVALIVYAFFCPLLNFRHVIIGHLGAVATVVLASLAVGVVWRKRASN